MKHFQKTILLSLLFLFFSCGQAQISIPKDMKEKFTAFKKKKKFLENKDLHYPGIGDKKWMPIYTDKINLAAQDFEDVAQSGNASDAEYQKAIKKGLQRFTDIYLEIDSEDKERICTYFEELMDIVGLESSNGQLNIFLYGFDPSKIIKE